MKIGIIGAGRIGTHLKIRLGSEGHAVSFLPRMTRTAAAFLRALDAEAVEAVFLTISTRDTGEAALSYILACMQAGIPLITCEKGALAYHCDVLKPYLKKIGFNATVGGGTRMLRYAADRYSNSDGPIEFKMVLNGSLNFIFDEMSGDGRSLFEACMEADERGYTEPGAHDPLSLVNSELRDVALKTCIFFNTILAKDSWGSCLKPLPELFVELDGMDLQKLVEDETGHRVFISISSEPFRHPEESLKHCFFKSHDGWNIIGGFRRVDRETDSASWLPTGIGNTIQIIEGNPGSRYRYTLSGPGAGYGPTISAMMADFADLCNK